ncbi:hypothetical protein MP228_005476 [Amoeboaphelidium protococcarum]|nr:hypothetical protein MP228_005476 [Amoeboaphelidium protococcarum]
MLASLFLPSNVTKSLQLLKDQRLLERQVASGQLPTLPENSPVWKHVKDISSFKAENKQVLDMLGDITFHFGVPCETIYDCAVVVLGNAMSSLLVDASLLYDIYEQGIIAALRCYQLGSGSGDEKYYKQASKWLQVLESKFSVSSVRVKLLKVKLYESKQQWSEAYAIYDSLIKTKTVTQNSQSTKSKAKQSQQDKEVLTFDLDQSLQIPVHLVQQAMKQRSQCGDTDSAIQLLVSMLDIFPSDPEIWMLLCSLYCKKVVGGDQSTADSLSFIDLAMYCVEELIVLRPLNYLYSTLYGELLRKKADLIVQSQPGGTLSDSKVAQTYCDTLSLSRKYFASTLELNPAFQYAAEQVCALQKQIKSVQAQFKLTLDASAKSSAQVDELVALLQSQTLTSSTA